MSQLSDAQVAEVKKQFLEYDKDNSGEISIEEAEKAFQKKVDDVRRLPRFMLAAAGI